MRIISSYHDYYDGVQAHGQDKRIVYIRNTVNHKLDKYPFIKVANSGGAGFHVNSCVIGFCGSLFPLLVLSGSKFGEPTKTKPCYGIDGVDTFLKENLNDKDYEKYDEGTYFNLNNWWKNQILYSYNRKSFIKYFEQATKNDDLFRKYNSPIWIAKPYFNPDDKLYPFTDKNAGPYVVTNPSLKPYEFVRIKNPYTAFQEIQQYLSGVLGFADKPIPAVSNEDLIESKGFDLKSSFRKDKKK